MLKTLQSVIFNSIESKVLKRYLQLKRQLAATFSLVKLLETFLRPHQLPIITFLLLEILI